MASKISKKDETRAKKLAGEAVAAGKKSMGKRRVSKARNVRHGRYVRHTQEEYEQRERQMYQDRAEIDARLRRQEADHQLAALATVSRDLIGLVYDREEQRDAKYKDKQQEGIKAQIEAARDVLTDFFERGQKVQAERDAAYAEKQNQPRGCQACGPLSDPFAITLTGADLRDLYKKRIASLDEKIGQIKSGDFSGSRFGKMGADGVMQPMEGAEKTEAMLLAQSLAVGPLEHERDELTFIAAHLACKDDEVLVFSAPHEKDILRNLIGPIRSFGVGRLPGTQDLSGLAGPPQDGNGCPGCGPN
jgi:hypothetical protein